MKRVSFPEPRRIRSNLCQRSARYFRRLPNCLVLIWLLAGFGISGRAATYVVNNTLESGGGCPESCSLRAAIGNANATSSADIIEFDPIVFASPQTITLTLGELSISNNGSLTINGPGADLLTLSGNSAHRVFSLALAATATLNNLKITQGVASTGGGINSFGTLTIANSIFTNNSATDFSGGGAIAAGNGTLSVSNSTISGNRAPGGGGIYGIVPMTISGCFITNNGNQSTLRGGGIRNDGSSLDLEDSIVDGNVGEGVESWGTTIIRNSTIRNNLQANEGGGLNANGTTQVFDSTISGNSSNWGGGIYSAGTMSLSNVSVTNNSTTNGGGLGGGIYHNEGSITIDGSTIANNSALHGGGIATNNFVPLNITNSTITGNSAVGNVGSGGGMFVSGATLTNVTICNNISNYAGGIWGTGEVMIRNSILADNKATQTDGGPDAIGALTSLGYNLIEDTSRINILGTTTGNILGQDPQLISLSNYGGTTKTVALQPSSPAIDAGDPGNSPATDQRGIIRPQDGDLNGTAEPDIGAYERQVTTFLVTKTADTNDSICDSDCSLREAIAAAVAAPLDKGIVFAPMFFQAPQTIVLTNGQLNFSNTGTLGIHGPGRDLLTVSGNDQSRIFRVTTTGADEIRDLTVTHGSTPFGSDGGAIYNTTGSLLGLNNVAITNNHAPNGGAIRNDAGTLTIRDSIISGNTSEGSGGAITNNIFGQTTGVLNLINTTVANNTTLSGGGGIYDTFGIVTLTDCVFTNNTVTGSSNTGGGLRSSGSVIIKGSAFSVNSSTYTGGAIQIDGSGSSLLLENSFILNNHASSGGGIGGNNATVVIRNSTISNNMASFRGGGIVADQGTLNITGSTINGNTASNAGGGLALFVNSSITNSTISGNSSLSAAGGIYGTTGVASLINVTVADNSANSCGGVWNDSGLNTLNTIIADNSASTSPDMCGTLTSQGYNLIENTSGATITGTVTGNILGQDPKLAPLTDNGGPTSTHALLFGSPAIDRGRVVSPPNQPVSNDQRGLPRPYNFTAIANAGGGNGSDIGAFERQLSDGPSIGGTITYGNAIGAPTPRFVSNVTVTGAGSPTMAITTPPPGAGEGTYILFGFGAGSYTVTPSKTGGVNGSITSFDAAKIAQHVAGVSILTGNQFVVADVSGNGTLSSFDAAQIARYVAGGSGFGLTGNWIFSPVNRIYPSVTTNITGEDYSALLMGEVSGNWNNTGARASSAGVEIAVGSGQRQK